MKKLLLILVLCLSTIGLVGCGSSAPTKVTLDPKNGQYQMLEVGKDIAEGNFTSNTKIDYAVSSQGSTSYDMNRKVVQNQKESSETMTRFAYGTSGDKIPLIKGEFLFVYVPNGEIITLSK